MTRRRTFLAAGASLVLVASLALSGVGGAPDEAAPQPTVADLMNQIKQLRQRVIELEKRVAKLEPQSDLHLHRDKHGVLYDDCGAPVGIWGVDVEGASLDQ